MKETVIDIPPCPNCGAARKMDSEVAFRSFDVSCWKCHAVDARERFAFRMLKDRDLQAFKPGQGFVLAEHVHIDGDAEKTFARDAGEWTRYYDRMAERKAKEQELAANVARQAHEWHLARSMNPEYV